METENYSLQKAISDSNAAFQGAKVAETERKMNQRVEDLQHQLNDMKEATTDHNQKLAEQVSKLQYENNELTNQIRTAVNNCFFFKIYKKIFFYFYRN